MALDLEVSLNVKQVSECICDAVRGVSSQNEGCCTAVLRSDRQDQLQLIKCEGRGNASGGKSERDRERLGSRRRKVRRDQDSLWSRAHIKTNSPAQ